MRLQSVALCVTAALLGGCATASIIGPEVSKEATSEEAQLQRKLLVETVTADQTRLQTIGYTIATDNRALCGDYVAAKAGFLVADLERAEPQLRKAFTESYAVRKGTLVVAVAEGTPADTAGLAPGDIIVAVNDVQETTTAALIGRLADALAEIEDGERLSLTTERRSARKVLQFAPDFGCAYGVAFANLPNVNAYADGKNVIVTRGMLRFADNDDELAIVIGHEYAHNAMQHVAAQRQNAMGGAIVGALFDVAAIAVGVNTGGAFSQLGASVVAGEFSEDFEREADTIGLYMAANAGYDPSVANGFWRRLAVDNPQAIEKGGSHPPTAERAAALDLLIDEIARKRTGSEGIGVIVPTGFEAPVRREPHEDGIADYPE